MIRLRMTDGPFGDCTSNWDVDMDRPYTVGEFIDWFFDNSDYRFMFERGTLLHGDAWIGEATLGERNKIFQMSNGRITKECSSEYINRIIKRVWINGGWGMYSAYITLVEEVPENAGD